MSNTPAPGSASLSIWQGQTYDQQFLLQDSSTPPNPLDLTGFTAQMMLRNAVDDPSPIVTWGTETGEIVLGGSNGLLSFNVSGAASLALPTDDDVATYVYDILLTSSSTPPFTQRVMQGVVVVFPAVTRPAGT